MTPQHEASQHPPPSRQKSRTNSSVWRDYGITGKPANKSRQPLWLKESEWTPQHLPPSSVQGFCNCSAWPKTTPRQLLIFPAPTLPALSLLLGHKQTSTSFCAVSHLVTSSRELKPQSQAFAMALCLAPWCCLGLPGTSSSVQGTYLDMLPQLTLTSFPQRPRTSMGFSGCKYHQRKWCSAPY